MQRAYRLKKNASFAYVYRKGQSLAHPLMILNYVSAKGTKVGVSVNKKVGKSVVRNLAKRRIYENFAPLIPRISGEYNYVVVARAPIAEASFQEIGEAIKALLVKAGHLPEDV